MRFPTVLLCGLMLAGCAGDKHPDANDPWRAVPSKPVPSAPASRTPAAKPIVTPGNAVTARVMSVNPHGPFVVVSFPIGAVPGRGRQLSVYRSGLKVAEIRMTDMRIDFNAIADITAGECRVGDEVKEN